MSFSPNHHLPLILPIDSYPYTDTILLLEDCFLIVYAVFRVSSNFSSYINTVAQDHAPMVLVLNKIFLGEDSSTLDTSFLSQAE